LLGSNRVDDKSYTLFGIRYAQFFRAGVEHRHYTRFDASNLLVFRSLVRVGIGYGNLNVLPLQKSYFAGGSNSVRAWKYRSLGPGGYNDINNIDQQGDIQIEYNIEYRFDITKSLEGALFTDIGNIWLIRKDTARNYAEFNFSNFGGQMAVGSGVGFRFDFSFFIIRIDWAMKIKDPAFTGDDRWVVRRAFNKAWKDDYKASYGHKYNFANINFGIGYPF
jgi:outer membrane protein assembly factor BamA